MHCYENESRSNRTFMPWRVCLPHMRNFGGDCRHSPTDQSGHRRIAALSLLCLTLSAVGCQSALPAATSATETPPPYWVESFPYRMTTAEQAMQAGKERLPAGMASDNIIARKISARTFNAWSGASFAMTADTPVWLVAVRGRTPDTSIATIDAYPAPGTKLAERPASVAAAMYFMFEANTSRSLGYGTLDLDGSPTFESVVELEEEPIPVVTASPFPSETPETVSPTPGEGSE